MTVTLTFYRWRSADGGAAQPDDTVEVEVGIAAFDDIDGHAVFVDATLWNEDLGGRTDGTPREWTLADALHRFRPNRIAVAYGDLYVDDRGVTA